MRFARPERLMWAVLLSVLVLSGLTLTLYWVYLLTTVAVSALIARGIGLVTNQAGLITLCQMSFAAVGGWVTSGAALAWPTAPFPLLAISAGVITAPIGLLIGIATARIRGVEFAVVTLGFAATLDLALARGSFPGVASGTPVLPAAPFDDPRWFFVLAWVLLIALQLGVAAVGRTSHGLGWTALRGSERAATALGVRVGASKASAFAIGALFAGTAGGLLAGQYGLLTTDVFSPLQSMVFLVTAVLCGASLFSGAVLAGIFSVFVPEILRRLGLPLDVGNALLALGAFDVLRRGGGGIAEQLRDWMQERTFRTTRVSCEFQPMTHRDQTDLLFAGHGLEVEGLTVDFGGHRVLERVDLSVGGGEVHALLGQNGAGKSTLVDAVSGFLHRYEGQVRLDGELVEGLTARERAQLGLRRTFQQAPALTDLTVGEYLRLAGGSVSADKSSAVIHYFGLPDPTVPIRLMDVGSRRILEIAGALAASPRALLIDEPAAGLAETERRALTDRVRRIPAEFGCAVLLIEHDMEFVRAAADRATLLDNGRVMTRGSAADVLNDPRVISTYLGKGAAS